MLPAGAAVGRASLRRECGSDSLLRTRMRRVGRAGGQAGPNAAGLILFIFLRRLEGGDDGSVLVVAAPPGVGRGLGPAGGGILPIFLAAEGGPIEEGEIGG